VRPAEPPKPAFSPFEADKNRKIQSEGTLSSVSAAAAPAPRALTPLETASRAVEAPRVKVPSAPVPEPAVETTAGALALAAEPVGAPETAAQLDLDRIRDTVTSALDTGGHNTAAVLLANGKWREKNGGIEVEVGLRKTMLSLTMNAEAEKICREALRSIGVPQKITFVSGEAATQSEASRPKPALSGTIQAAALDHPLVKQAQELFQAEVRSVLDLRDKK
jgi:DNA polymerase-3 subunit gamma/tau